MNTSIETHPIDASLSDTGPVEAGLIGNPAAPQPLAISVENLSKRYGEALAVDRLSLNVPAGRLFGFLGPNGAGKSTTIGCMTGLIDPTSGVIRLLGERFTDDSIELKRRIGVMPEGLALFDHLY